MPHRTASLAAALVLSGCGMQTSELPASLKVGAATFRVPKSIQVLSAQQLENGVAAIRVRNVLAVPTDEHQLCDGLDPKGGLSIWLMPAPPGATQVFRAQVGTIPPEQPLVRTSVPPAAEGPEPRALRSLKIHGEGVVTTTTAGWPLVNCSRTCRVIFVVDQIIVELQCGYFGSEPPTQRQIWQLARQAEAKVRSWRVTA